jgi:hypothetical protein
VAARNDNPMPYEPGSLAEARLLLETLCPDWKGELSPMRRTARLLRLAVYAALAARARYGE